jgi:hypothetical protein
MKTEPIKLKATKLSDNELERNFNRPLADLFGIDTVSSQPMFRISWSDEQFEKRLTECTDAGITLLKPEVRLLPKYQWIRARYIIEHLVAIPNVNIPELPTTKVSYEIIWTFEDKDGNYLPPHLEAAKFLINTMLSAMGRHQDGRTPLQKYVDDEFSQEASLDAKEKRIAEISEYLFGEQSSLQGTTVTGESIIVP